MRRRIAGRALLAGLAFAATALGQQSAFTLANDKLELAVLQKGGYFSRIHLKDDAEKLSPISSTVGHIVCVDYFGPPSNEEREAGLGQHGEVRFLEWKLHSQEKRGKVTTLACGTRLQTAGQEFGRTLRVVDGEFIVYVGSVLENLHPIDRPITWAEHGTVGSPFLEPGVTVIDISTRKAMTRPQATGARPPAAAGGASGPRGPMGASRLKPGQPFDWPLAPGRDGQPVDLRPVPEQPGSMDITTQLMPSEGIAFATALNVKKRLLFGYAYHPQEFPWLANWESYGQPGQLNRGLEFAMTPYGMPRREAVSMGKLFDTPTFRWLPAKGKVTTSYVMFLARTPEGMRGVDEIKREGGYLVIRDAKAGKELRLQSSLDW